MKNPDRDKKHRRRREAGSTGDSPDGKRIAEALYGGPADSNTDENKDMANPNLDRSKRHERQIVREAEDAGLTAERAYASNGKSLGEHEECDVRLTTEDGTSWTVQAKRKKRVANYLTCENTDVVVTREDRGKNLVVVPLEDFLDLLTEE